MESLFGGGLIDLAQLGIGDDAGQRDLGHRTHYRGNHGCGRISQPLKHLGDHHLTGFPCGGFMDQPVDRVDAILETAAQLGCKRYSLALNMIDNIFNGLDEICDRI